MIPIVIEIPKEDTVYNNCYLYIQTRVKSLPVTSQMKFSDIPRIGGAKLMYSIPHYIYIESITENGAFISESNYGGNFINNRFLTFGYMKDHSIEYILPADDN